MAINVSSLVKNFMSAKTTKGLESRKALSDFMKSNNAKGLSGTNVAERMDDRTFSSIRLGESQQRAQDFLAVPSGGANGEYYFLPNFQAYNNNYHVERGAYEIFDSNFSLGQVYNFNNVKNVMPAKGSINPDGTLNITERGSIDFGNGESIGRFKRDSVKGMIKTETSTASPEQQLAEDLAAKNIKLLDEAGHPVAEPPPKVTPQPSQPVPDKTVTAPEPKPVDPISETGKPVAAPPKEESAKKSLYEKYKEELEEIRKQQGLEVTPEYERGLLGSKLRENGAKGIGELSLKRKFDAEGSIADQLKNKFNLSKEDIEKIRRNISDVGTEDNLTNLEKMLSGNSNESLDAMKTLKDNRIFDDISNFDRIQDKVASNVSDAAREQAAIKTAQTEIPKGVSDDTAKILEEQRRNSARKQAEPISTGSGRTVSESADKTEKVSDLTNYVTKKGDKYVFDADRLRSSLSNKGVGKKEANDYFVKNIQKDFETTYDEIMNSEGKSISEKNQALVNAINDYNKRAAGGPDVGDYIFGNQLHTGALGAAALIGVSSQAFGGHKSNAELYSSPF